MDGLTEILQGLLELITNWKTLGALGLAAGVITLAVQLTKVPKIRRWIDTRSWGAWVAIGLGTIGGALAALAAHEPWITVAMAALGGALAGATGTGFYEATAGQSAKRKALALLGGSMTNPPASSAEIRKMQAELESAKKLTDEGERLKAKAAWLDRWLL